MTEELQNLLEKIQKDGVEKAEEEAQKIISDAKQSAKQIVEDAEKKAKESISEAESKAEAFQQRAEKALEQTARDVVLGVGEAVSATMKNIINQEISNVMSVDDLKAILTTVVDAYCKDETGDSSIEILVNPEQQSAIVDFFTSKFAQDMKNGLEIKADSSVNAGFKVSMVNDNIQHDFTSEAITDAMSQMLRPHLAQIVKEAHKD